MKQSRSIFALVIASLSTALAVACTEAAEPYAPGSSISDGGGATDASTDASKPKKDAASAPGSDGGSAVINEISGEKEWVELYNRGGVPLALAGYKVADRSKDAGTPKMSEAFTFPAGTTLEANGYLIVAGNAPADGGPAPCPSGVSECFSAEWGISNKAGDTLYLLAADDSVIDEAEYPAGSVPAGSSWSRSPNGDGDFAVTSPSPGGPTP